ncbi:hypothetical protein GCM10017673_12370 [Streptosporangium violaceochromogenes]|nr:hypothetical protein GCM10017673_12370 [Streptosporangium violaceochromogenes]
MSVAAFISSQKTEYGISHVISCRALGVSQSWFYKWKARAPTPRERRRADLGRLLERADAEQLPAIPWTITDGCSGPTLVGECVATDPIQRRDDFEAWRCALGAEAWPGGLRRGKSVHLHASINDEEGVSISIAAEVLAEEM